MVRPTPPAPPASPPLRARGSPDSPDFVDFAHSTGPWFAISDPGENQGRTAGPQYCSCLQNRHAADPQFAQDRFFAYLRGQTGVLHDDALQGRIISCSFVFTPKCQQVPDLGFLRRADAWNGRRARRPRKTEPRGPAESYRTPVSCPERPRFWPWDPESYISPSSWAKRPRSSTDESRQHGPRFPPGQDSRSRIRSRTASHLIHERIIGRKSFAYCPALDTRTNNWTKVVRVLPCS